MKNNERRFLNIVENSENVYKYLLSWLLPITLCKFSRLVSEEGG